MTGGGGYTIEMTGNFERSKEAHRRKKTVKEMKGDSADKQNGRRKAAEEDGVIISVYLRG